MINSEEKGMRMLTYGPLRSSVVFFMLPRSGLSLGQKIVIIYTFLVIFGTVLLYWRLAGK